MTLPSAHRLSTQIATTRRLDSNEQSLFVERISSMRIMLDGDDDHCCDSLDAAIMLLQTAVPSEEGSVKILRMVASLVALVEESIGYAAALPLSRARAASAAPDERTEVPRERQTSALRLVDEMLLGQILVESCCLDEEELQEGLAFMQAEGVRLGEALVALELVTPAHVDAALLKQREMREALAPDADEPRSREVHTETRGAHDVDDPRDWQESSGLRLANEALLGEILLSRGAVDREDHEAALALQRRNGWLLGETLVHLGVVRPEIVQDALRSQGLWNR